jgi:ATP-dependent DNA helicase PIF1
MTGVAADKIGGFTLHSFAGVGVDMTLSDRLACFDAISVDIRALERWINTHVLIIDEGKWL